MTENDSIEYCKIAFNVTFYKNEKVILASFFYDFGVKISNHSIYNLAIRFRYSTFVLVYLICTAKVLIFV